MSFWKTALLSYRTVLNGALFSHAVIIIVIIRIFDVSKVDTINDTSAVFSPEALLFI